MTRIIHAIAAAVLFAAASAVAAPALAQDAQPPKKGEVCKKGIKEAKRELKKSMAPPVARARAGDQIGNAEGYRDQHKMDACLKALAKARSLMAR